MPTKKNPLPEEKALRELRKEDLIGLLTMRAPRLDQKTFLGLCLGAVIDWVNETVNEAYSPNTCDQRLANRLQSIRMIYKPEN